MKKCVVMLVLLLSFALAQTDLSTPGGASVLATFITQPAGAEIYVSNTYIGVSPVRVRFNADTPTPYQIRPMDIYQAYSDTVTLVLQLHLMPLSFVVRASCYGLMLTPPEGPA